MLRQPGSDRRHETPAGRSYALRHWRWLVDVAADDGAEREKEGIE
jgi:hypothetical protein